MNGKTYVAVFGIVAYEDQFGPHWTRFCFWKNYGGAGNIRFNAEPCTSWNTIGDVRLTFHTMPTGGQ